MDEPFVILDDAILDHLPTIKSQGLTIYTVLKKHINHKTKKAFPSIERIARLACLTKKTVIKYLRILEDTGLIKISKRWINKKRCFHEYLFPKPPIAFPWEKTIPQKQERNTPQPDPNNIKEKKEEIAITMPEEEKKTEITEPVCECIDTVVFPDGRMVCKSCLRTGVIDPVKPQSYQSHMRRLIARYPVSGLLIAKLLKKLLIYPHSHSHSKIT